MSVDEKEKVNERLVLKPISLGVSKSSVSPNPRDTGFGDTSLPSSSANILIILWSVEDGLDETRSLWSSAHHTQDY